MLLLRYLSERSLGLRPFDSGLLNGNLNFTGLTVSEGQGTYFSQNRAPHRPANVPQPETASVSNKSGKYTQEGDQYAA
jgi:hypothetical protein